APGDPTAPRSRMRKRPAGGICTAGARRRGDTMSGLTNASQHPASAAGLSSSSADQRQGRILVVDDTPQNVRLLEAILIPRGYTVVGASSGQQALDLVAEQIPDLVLLDIMMPGMDGHEVCRRLRADPSTALLPVVMVTASGDQNKVKALESGADDFIPK